MDKWGRRKDGRPYKKTRNNTPKRLVFSSGSRFSKAYTPNHKPIKAITTKKPLKIVLRDVHDERFLKLMNESISKTPRRIQNRIHSVILLKKKASDPVGQSIGREDGTYDIKIFYQPKNLKSYPLVFRHETDHIFFDTMEQENPAKIKKYISNISGLLPFNDKLIGYFKDFRKAIKNGNKRQVIEKLYLYTEEFHSETHEAWGRVESGLDPFKVDKATKENLHQAVIAYNKLHKN